MIKNQAYTTAVIVLTVAFIAVFGLLLVTALLKLADRKKKMLLQEQLFESRFREELLRSVLEMQEHTFQSVSREIHDNVGQLLSLAKLNLNILCFEQAGNESLPAIKDLVGKAMIELRNLGTVYHADSIIDAGFIAAIRYQVAQLQRTGMFRISFVTEIENLPVSKSSAILLYRVIQEAINNIIRHAGATEITLSVGRNDNGISIAIADNGKGFDRNDPAFHHGIGLKSMEQRVAMTGALLEIQSEEGKGTTITISLNKQNDQDRITG